MSEPKQKTKFKLEGSIENGAPASKGKNVLKNSIFTIVVLILFLTGWLLVTDQYTRPSKKQNITNIKTGINPKLAKQVDSLERILLSLKSKYNISDYSNLDKNPITFKVVTPPLKSVEDFSTTQKHNIILLDSTLNTLGVELAEFHTYTEALQFLEDLRINGYEDATLICIKDGQIINYNEALLKLEEHNK